MQGCSLTTILNPKELTDLIFHPSQTWIKISENRHLYIEHILPDSYLTAHKTQIDAFLALQGLPATHTETRRLENDKIPHTYLVLRVETRQWLLTIVPIRQTFQQRATAYSSLPAQMNEARGLFQSPLVGQKGEPLK